MQQDLQEPQAGLAVSLGAADDIKTEIVIVVPQCFNIYMFSNDKPVAENGIESLNDRLQCLVLTVRLVGQKEVNCLPFVVRFSVKPVDELVVCKLKLDFNLPSQ